MPKENQLLMPAVGGSADLTSLGSSSHLKSIDRHSMASEGRVCLHTAPPGPFAHPNWMTQPIKITSRENS